MKPQINLEPIKDFLTTEVTPGELCQYLDEVYFKCTQMAMKNCDNGVIPGLYFLYMLKKALEKC